MYEPVQTKAAYLYGIVSGSDKVLHLGLVSCHSVIPDQTITATECVSCAETS